MASVSFFLAPLREIFTNLNILFRLTFRFWENKRAQIKVEDEEEMMNEIEQILNEDEAEEDDEEGEEEVETPEDAHEKYWWGYSDIQGILLRMVALKTLFV